jgi:hypothetical protein
VTVALVVIGLLVLTGWAILLWILRQPDASDVHADGFRTLDGSAIGATTYADVFVRAGVSTVQFTESMRRVNLALAGALPSMRRLTDALARAQELDAVARSLRRQGICPDCRGSGLDLDRSIAGHVKVRDALSLFTEANPPPECPECLGSGRVTVVYVVAFQHREQGEGVGGFDWFLDRAAAEQAEAERAESGFYGAGYEHALYETAVPASLDREEITRWIDGCYIDDLCRELAS